MTSVFSWQNSISFATLHSVLQGQICLLFQVFLDFLLLHSSGSEVKASSWNAGDQGLIPGWEDPLEKENGNPLQYSCLENPCTEEPGRL